MRVRLRKVQVTYNQLSDLTVNLGNFTPPTVEEDEVTFFVWARDTGDYDNGSWSPLGGTCHQFDFQSVGQVSPDYMDTIFDHAYAGDTVPRYFDLRLEAFEDDIPSDFLPFGTATTCNTSSRCVFDGTTCCFTIINCLFDEADDLYCDANPFKTNMDYRSGPPCQWYNHGFVTGSGCADSYYEPEIESFWRYTSGTSCNDAIDLGALTVGGTLSHFNSNECYSNNWSASPGNDVFYAFTVPSTMGVRISLCGSNGATFDSYLYLLDSNCSIDTSNDDGCGTQSLIAKPICNPGTYYIVVDGKTASEMGTFTIEVSEDSSFTFSASISKTDISCNGGSDGTATAAPNG